MIGRVADEKSKIDAEHWIEGAMDILSEQGIDAVRIEPLAKKLGITKGSFYWHFKDRGALLEAILDHWRRRATLDIITRLEDSTEGADVRLATLLRLPFRANQTGRGANIELAIRLWGRKDARVRAALQEVDGLRLRYMDKLLREIGLSAGEAAARAMYCYAFMRVAGSLTDRGNDRLISDCVHLMTRR